MQHLPDYNFYWTPNRFRNHLRPDQPRGIQLLHRHLMTELLSSTLRIIRRSPTRFPWSLEASSLQHLLLWGKSVAPEVSCFVSKGYGSDLETFGRTSR